MILLNEMRAVIHTGLMVSLFATTGLIGCQSAPIKSPQQADKRVIPTLNVAELADEGIIEKEQLMQWSGHYDWQLAQVINQNGNIVAIENFAPITLAIEPSSVRFYQGCAQYMLDFYAMSAPPYPYYSHLAKVPATCNDDNDFDNAPDAGTNTDTVITEANSIQSLFAKYAPVRLNFELLPDSQLIPHSKIKSSTVPPANKQSAPKYLALNIENGKRLIFSGTTKALAASTGLPITNELLEQYHWTLVSAVSNNYDDNGQLIRRPMGNFYHPDHPISVDFMSWPDNQYAAFSSDCNSSMAPYFLLNDYMFKVGSIISTVMGCGETGNRIETALFDLMRDSSSKLTLSLQPSQPISANQVDFPRYNLLQTMASGETLVWQNEIKEGR